MWKLSAALVALVAALARMAPTLSTVQPLTRDVTASLQASNVVQRCKSMHVVITGGSAGVGLQAAKRLAECGAEVVVTGRSRKRAEKAAGGLGGGSKAHKGLELDLTSRESVESFASEIKAQGKPLDVLILNAGMTYGPDYTGPYLAKWPGGLQDTMVSANHLGHFLLVNLLRDEILAWKSRIVFVSSISHSFATESSVLRGNEEWSKGLAPEGTAAPQIGQFDIYGATKLMNVLMAKKLDQMFADNSPPSEGARASTVVCTPGFVSTSIGNVDRDQSFNPLEYIPLTRSAESGGNVLAYAAFVDMEKVHGKMLFPYWLWKGAGRVFSSTVSRGYFHNVIQEMFLQKFTPANTIYAFDTNAPSYNQGFQDRLWNWSAQAVGIKG